MTVASLAARTGMRPQILWVLAALSVALNLFFIVGALWIRIHGPPPPLSPAERLQYIGAELALDPGQQEAFDRYSDTVRTRMQLMHKTVDPLIGRAWAEVAKPDANEVQVVRLFDEAGDARRGFMRELAPVTLSFLAALSPEQREKFVELIRRKPWGHSH